jgi:hypothetical protein
LSPFAYFRAYRAEISSLTDSTADPPVILMAPN